MINIPTDKQVDNSAGMGWSYEGEGIFTRAQQVGYFTDHGFIKE